MSQQRWDGKPRRKDDFEPDGRLKAAVIMARIDERVNTLITNALEVKTDLVRHKEDDDRQFKAINLMMARVGGGLAVLIFVLDLIFRK